MYAYSGTWQVTQPVLLVGHNLWGLWSGVAWDSQGSRNPPHGFPFRLTQIREQSWTGTKISDTLVVAVICRELDTPDSEFFLVGARSPTEQERAELIAVLLAAGLSDFTFWEGKSDVS